MIGANGHSSESGSEVRATVIIVNWNGGAYLRECLEALLNQTETNFRAILVDNASTDGSVIGLDALDPRLEVIALDVNVGFALANNLAVRERVRAGPIVLLNPDAFPQPDWLAELLAAAAVYPEAGSFGSRLIDASDGRRLDGTGDVYHAAGIGWRRRHGALIGPIDDIADEIFAPCAAAALYRYDAWVEAGGFDEHYFCYFEDVDLGFRLRLLGWASRYVPSAVCRHVGSGLTGRRSVLSAYYGQRNLLWTFITDMPAPLLWPLLPAHAVMTLYLLLRYALRGQAAVLLRAKRDALAELPRVLRRRKEVQAKRRIGSWHLARSLTWRGIR